MRPRPDDSENGADFLSHVDPSIVSKVPQEPVCFDDFDADEIWAQARPSRGGLALQSKASSVNTSSGIRGFSESSGRGRGEMDSVSSSNRWQRGVALPPTDGDVSKRGSSGVKKSDEAENPEDLWDDPVDISGGVGGDLSQYGALLDDVGSPVSNRRSRGSSIGSSPDMRPPSGGGFDLSDISNAAKQFELELHGTKSRSSSVVDSDDTSDPLDSSPVQRVDPHRPLAFAGTTIRSGSGDDVNVFEDFGAPEEGKKIPGVGEKEDPDSNASSRLMKMIGVEGSSNEGSSSKLMANWRTENASNEPVTEPVAEPAPNNASNDNTSSAIGEETLPSFLDNSPVAFSVPKNPWGDPVPLVQGAISLDRNGLLPSLAAVHLSQSDAENKAEELKERRQLEEKRLAEEAKQRQATLQAQAEAQRQKEAQAAAAAQAEAQRQQQASSQANGAQYNAQVEQILMERIVNVLEAGWGRSDLANLLSTLHREDSRVIPLLGTVDDMKALISRHPNRIALGQDSAYGVEMAVLLMNNAQFLQKQREEEFRREEELRQRQQMMQEMQRAEEEARARERAAILQQQQQQAQQQQQTKITNDPWYYADPQGNIQGPFKGEEMRQWLDAGYFKGDLPISQNPNSGSFQTLTSLFPDISIAFQPQPDTAALEREQVKRAAAIAAAQAKEEEERRLAEEAAKAAEQERIEAEKKVREEKLMREKEAAAVAAAAVAAEAARKEADALAAKQASAQAVDQNSSSAQLKMLLGLNSTVAHHSQSNDSDGIVIGSAAPQPKSSVSDDAIVNTTPSLNNTQQHYHLEVPSRKSSSRSAPAQPQKVQAQPRESKTSSPLLEPATVAPAPVRVQPAWGGAATSKTGSKKSISEIQQEEARVSARLKERKNVSSSSGWANIAASGGGSTAWSSGTIKQGSANISVASVSRESSVGSAPSLPQVRTKQVAKVGTTILQKPSAKQQPKGSAVEDFGVGGKMSQSLESWCKEQMKKLNGSDDLTLVSFCMTLSDPVEIRQYLTAYLGSSGQVNNFATEFINRKGGGKANQDEWESAGNAKKGRKKKNTTSSR